MVGFKPAWFIQVDPTNNFPRYIKTIAPLGKRGSVIGPLGGQTCGVAADSACRRLV